MLFSIHNSCVVPLQVAAMNFNKQAWQRIGFFVHRCQRFTLRESRSDLIQQLAWQRDAILCINVSDAQKLLSNVGVLLLECSGQNKDCHCSPHFDLDAIFGYFIIARGHSNRRVFFFPFFFLPWGPKKSPYPRFVGHELRFTKIRVNLLAKDSFAAFGMLQ